MRLHSASALALTAIAGFVAGCASPPTSSTGSASAGAPWIASPDTPVADVPAAVRPPLNQAMFLEAKASGVQIYECATKPGATPEWTLQAPEALLADRSGTVIGKHYAGPTWESADGSIVTGEVKARDAGPTPTAIPWLLLGVKGTSGAGVLTQTKSIQRLGTVGGLAPAEACTAAAAGKVVRVPYAATYKFYRVAP